MLVLTRKANEQIMIGEDVSLTVIEVRGDKVRLGITAPRAVRIDRAEVRQRILDEQDDASSAVPTRNDL